MRNFIFSSTAAVYGNPARVPVREDDATVPMSPYGSSKLMTEVMLRDAGAAHGLRHVILRYFNVAGADPQGRTGQSTKGATHLIKVAVETALGKRPSRSTSSAPTTRRRTAPASATTSTSPTSPARISMRWRICAAAARSLTLNCGYGRGFSVLEVIETVKRVSRRRFQGDVRGRRPGDPARIVAASDRIRAVLTWRPQFDDLATIVTHALAWERKLAARAR